MCGTAGRAYLCTDGCVNYCHAGQSTIIFQRSVIYICKIISECTKENMEINYKDLDDYDA
jgi:hypothetical protein